MLSSKSAAPAIQVKNSDCIDTLPPAIPQFTEAASFTQAVKSLLLDQLQDLWLNSLPQLTAATDKHTHAHYLLLPGQSRVWNG